MSVASFESPLVEDDSVPDKILCESYSYTKRIRRERSDPYASRTELYALQEELDQFRSHLPTEIGSTTERLGLMIYSNEATSYVSLHTMWLLCHCDLYRHCVPGLRESTADEALASSPADFVQHCQRTCLDAATRLCGFWSDIYHLMPTEYLGDGNLAVSIYQVAQIVLHLPLLLSFSDETERGRDASGFRSVYVLQKQLKEALHLAIPEHLENCNFSKCLRDAERLILALSRSVARSLDGRPRSPGQTNSGTIEDDEDDVGARQEHLQSRHHMLAYIERDREAAEDNDSSLAVPYATERLHDTSACSMRLRENDAAAADDMTNHHEMSLLEATFAGSLPEQSKMIDGTFPECPPWDPFDMEMNAYYDCETIGLAGPEFFYSQ